VVFWPGREKKKQNVPTFLIECDTRKGGKGGKEERGNAKKVDGFEEDGRL